MLRHKPIRICVNYVTMVGIITLATHLTVVSQAAEDQTERENNPFIPKSGQFIDDKPDLVINGFGVAADPDGRKYVKVRVHNAGPQPSGRYFKVKAADGIAVVEYSIPSRRGLWVPIRDPSTRLHGCRRKTIEAFVDSTGRIDEAHENNNVESAVVGYPCPDLAIEEFQPVKEGGRWRIKATIANLGELRSTPTNLHYSMQRGAGSRRGNVFRHPLSRKMKVPALNPGERRTFMIGRKRLRKRGWDVSMHIFPLETGEISVDNNSRYWSN